MKTRFCRDCLNFEDRREIDGTVLCTENMRPFICCEEFQPKYAETNLNGSRDRFCFKCISFENINDIVLCSKNHQPEVACKGFRSTFEKFKATRRNTRLKNVSTSHTMNSKAEESIRQILRLKYQIEFNINNLC